MLKFSRIKEFIFITLKEKNITFFKLDKVKDCFIKQEASIYSIELLNNEIINQNICNPTFLSELILEYFQNNKLKKPYIIIINTQYLTSDENINYKILQLLITLNKIPGKIELITNKNIFEIENKITEAELKKINNLLIPFYPNPNSNPKKWLYINFFMLTTLIISGIFLINYKTNQIKNMKLKIQALKIENETKLKQIKESKITKKNHKKTNNVSKIISVINLISRTIPDNSLLTKLEIKKYDLYIEGSTTEKEEINLFLTKLKNSKRYHSIELLNNQESKNKTNFKITAKNLGIK